VARPKSTRILPILTCPHCGKDFPQRPVGPKQTFCSRSCGALHRYRERTEERHCEQCGKPFRARVASLSKGFGKFCEMACYAASLRECERVKLTCPVCGKDFERSLSHGRKTPTRPVCSRECKEQRARTRDAARTRPCKHCGKPFMMPRRSSNKGLYCSQKCKYAAMRKANMYPYYGPEWRRIAREVRERDNHTCQMCGLHQTAPHLHVHHIRPRRTFRPEDHEAMNDPSNLVTLCSFCHGLAEIESTAFQRRMGLKTTPILL
jgi:endogenous inhibitor of DNA gyrase (YacG/DUF329 family)